MKTATIATHEGFDLDLYAWWPESRGILAPVAGMPLYAFGAPLRHVLPYVPLFSGHSLGIAVVSYADGLTFGLGADRTSTPDLDVLAEGIAASFAELPTKLPQFAT